VREGDGNLRPPQRRCYRWFNGQDFTQSYLLHSLGGVAIEEDVDYLVRVLEVIVAFIDFALSLLVVRVVWLWSILECPPKLVALLDSVVVLRVPWALLFGQFFETTGGFLLLSFAGPLSSSSAHEMILSLSLVMELGRR
jgi:hypothetical protein